MNILKYSIVTFLVLIGVFFGIGIFNPGFSYECKAEVDADVEQAWEIFTEPDLMSEWMLDLEEVKQLAEGENHVGDKFRFRFKQNGDELVVTETVTAYRTGEYYEFQMEAEALDADTKVNFYEDGGKTTIHAVTDVRPRGLVQRSLFYLMQGTFQEQSELQYSRLKELIEGKVK